MKYARNERVTLPNTENGRFMAREYKEDMENVGMTVTMETYKEAITIVGYIYGEIAEEYVEKLKEAEKKRKR